MATDRGRIRAVIDAVLSRGGGWTTAGEATELLAAVGIESGRRTRRHDRR